MVDTLQDFRMLALWPTIVGITGFYLMRLVLIFVNDCCKLSRTDLWAAIITGILAGLVAVMISLLWDNYSRAWWVFFTVGLILLAVVHLVTAVQVARMDVREE